MVWDSLQPELRYFTSQKKKNKVSFASLRTEVPVTREFKTLAAGVPAMDPKGQSQGVERHGKACKGTVQGA